MGLPQLSPEELKQSKIQSEINLALLEDLLVRVFEIINQSTK